jgi:hypothetical protein
MVQRAAGQEVPGVVVGHVPHRLGVVAEGVRAPRLLEAPQLDAAVTGRRGQKVAAAGKSKGFFELFLRDSLQNLRLGCTKFSPHFQKLHSLIMQSPEEEARRLPLQGKVKVFLTFL